MSPEAKLIVALLTLVIVMLIIASARIYKQAFNKDDEVNLKIKGFGTSEDSDE